MREKFVYLTLLININLGVSLAGRHLLPACLSFLYSHLRQLTRAHLLPGSFVQVNKSNSLSIHVLNQRITGKGCLQGKSQQPVYGFLFISKSPERVLRFSIERYKFSNFLIYIVFYQYSSASEKWHVGHVIYQAFPFIS
jgi:hypothetical protein